MGFRAIASCSCVALDSDAAAGRIKPRRSRISLRRSRRTNRALNNAAASSCDTQQLLQYLCSCCLQAHRETLHLLQPWLSIEWEEEVRARTQRLRDDCIAGSTRELGKGFHRCSATEKSQQKALHRSTRRTPKRSHFKRARASTQASIGNSHARLQRRLIRNKLMGERSVILLSASEPRLETAVAAAAATITKVATCHAEQTRCGRRRGGGDKPLAVLMGCRPKKALICSTSFPPVERVRLHTRRGGQLQLLRTSVVNSEVQNLSTWRLCSSTVSRRRENM